MYHQNPPQRSGDSELLLDRTQALAIVTQGDPQARIEGYFLVTSLTYEEVSALFAAVGHDFLTQCWGLASPKMIRYVLDGDLVRPTLHTMGADGTLARSWRYADGPDNERYDHRTCASVQEVYAAEVAVRDLERHQWQHLLDLRSAAGVRTLYDETLRERIQDLDGEVEIWRTKLAEISALG